MQGRENQVGNRKIVYFLYMHITEKEKDILQGLLSEGKALKLISESLKGTCIMLD